MGLKYDPVFIESVLKGVLRKMRDSSTYQAILEEGRVEGRTEGRTEGELYVLLRGGTRRFGPPDAKTKATLEGIDSQEVIDRLVDRLFDVTSWEDLLR